MNLKFLNTLVQDLTDIKTSKVQNLCLDSWIFLKENINTLSEVKTAE